MADRGCQRPRRNEQLIDAVEAAIEHPTQFRRRPGSIQGLDTNPRRRKIVEWNVDPVEIAIIVPAVLQMIDDLQRRAERVRGGVAGVRFAVEIEQEAPDRVGRIETIAEQVLPIVVAILDGVLLEGLEQVARMVHGHGDGSQPPR